MPPREDYIEVAERVQMFYEKYPQGSLQGTWCWLSDDRTTLVYTARAFRDPADPVPGVGHASEPFPGVTNFTRGSEIMNAETSAWGRAICALGIGANRGIASANEVRAQQARVHDLTAPPVLPTVTVTKGPTVDDQWASPAPFENTAPAAYTGPEPSPGDYASPKQLGLIRSKCKESGFDTPEQQLQLVNTCLDLADLPHVDSFAQLNKRAASKVIDAILKSVTVEAATKPVDLEHEPPF